MILKQIFNLLKLLNGDQGTLSIAAGVTCGFILGMTPAFSLQTMLIYVCLFFFRIQMGAAFGTAVLFALPAYLLDPVFHDVGTLILQQPSLRPLFTELYHLPIVPFTRFNNTVVMGSGVVALALSPFVFVIARILVIKYREKIVARFQQTKLWHSFKATSLYNWYVKYDELFG